MKKLIVGVGIIAALLAAVVPVQADQYYQEVTIICTNGGTEYSDPLAVAGLLDKVEYIKGGADTQTFTVATFSGTTAIDTLATKQVTAAASGVVRPRVVGMTTAGVALAGAVTTASVTTNSLGQVLTAPATTTTLVGAYERPRIGGNVKIRVASDSAATSGAAASTNTFRIYLVPQN